MDIFNFSDYREIIRSWVADRPQKGRGEYQKMATLLAIPASVLSQTLSGQRELGADSAYLLSEYMGLVGIERDYFVTLAQTEKAANHKFKSYLKNKLKGLKEESTNASKRVAHERTLNEKDQQIFYSSWMYQAVRLRCDFKKGAHFDELHQELKIPQERLSEILEFLVRTGLVISEGSHYVMGPSRTFVGRDSPMLSRHHTNWRIKSLDKVASLSKEEFMFTCPIACSTKDYEKIREKFTAMIQEIYDTVKDSESQELAYVGIDLFRVKS